MSEFDSFLADISMATGGDNDPLSIRTEETTLEPTTSLIPGPVHVPQYTSGDDSIIRHALLRELLPVSSEGIVEDVPEDSLLPQEDIGGKRKRKSTDPYAAEYEMLKGANKIKQESVDPYFPTSVLIAQEDFIFGDDEDDEAPPPEPIRLSRWDAYEKRVLRLSKSLARKSTTVLKKKGLEEQIFRYQIFMIKQRILEILREVAALHGTDTRFPHLLQEVNDDGMVSLEGIHCSKCGGSDAEGNDILLCDMESCCRAYHQKCLDPPVLDLDAIKDDPFWFCWVCNTLSQSLALINAKNGLAYERVEEVFPEVAAEAASWTNKYDADFYDPELPGLGTIAAQGKKRVVTRTRDDDDSDAGSDDDGRGGKRKKKKPHPNQPAFPDSAYVLWQKEVLPQLKLEMPTARHAEIMSRLGNIWNEMTLQQKEPFILRGEEIKGAYREKLTAFHQNTRSPLSPAVGRKSGGMTGPYEGKRITCAVCGKSFKTDAGYKYHITHVCLIDKNDGIAGLFSEVDDNAIVEL